MPKNRGDELLYHILLRDIADKLKSHAQPKPRGSEDIMILFTDFQGLTTIVSTLPADRLVTGLNDLFNHFDYTMDHHGVEKITTISNASMAAGGHPRPPSPPPPPTAL